MISSSWIWLLSPVVLVAALATVLYDLNYGPYWIIPTLAGILFFSALAQRVEAFRICQPLIWIGQRSIIFYVSHAVFINLAAQFMVHAGVTNYSIAAVASIFLSLAGGWSLACAADRWPPAQQLFTFRRTLRTQS